MERIKLAIEKAKAGESALTKPATAPLRKGIDSKVPADNYLGATKSHAMLSNPVAVQYSQTAVVSLDAAHLESHRIISHHKTHPASWAFDVLRTQVLQKMDENGWRTLAITSPTVESGKTVVSINLAMSIAQHTQRTALLVDFDLRRPSVARTLGLNRTTSLNNVLDEHVDVGEALVNPGIERFVVLPTARPVNNASEVLSSANVGALINDLRERYDDRIVIFDLPPVLVADDVMAVMPRIDCVLLVVANGASTKNEIEESMKRLSRGNLLGVVLNKDEAPAYKDYY